MHRTALHCVPAVCTVCWKDRGEELDRLVRCLYNCRFRCGPENISLAKFLPPPQNKTEQNKRSVTALGNYFGNVVLCLAGNGASEVQNAQFSHQHRNSVLTLNARVVNHYSNRKRNIFHKVITYSGYKHSLLVSFKQCKCRMEKCNRKAWD